MARQPISGVALHKERKLHTPDTRSMVESVSDFFCSANTTCIVIGIIVCIALFEPALAWIAPFPMLIAAIVHHKNPEHLRLPHRIPYRERMIDRSDPEPGRKSFSKSSGILLLGYAKESGGQVWMNAKDLCTHIFMLGTTGAGKTYNFASIVVNFLTFGSGVFFSDCKGATDLPWSIATISRGVGREDDMLIISMLTSNKLDPDEKTSHNINVCQGNADSIMQLLSAMSPKAEGANAVFVQQGQALARGVLTILTDLRDKHGEDFSIQTVREALTIDAMDKFVEDPRLTDLTKQALIGFLNTVGYTPPSKRKDSQTGAIKPVSADCVTQFGYGSMNYTGALSELADTYGFVFRGKYPEIDFRDVAQQRRNVVSLLPALEKSQNTLKTTGQLIVSGIKDAVARRLSSTIEGNREEVLDSLSMAANTPYGIISDEHGQIDAPGIGLTMAQGRSLKVFFGIGTQSYIKMKMTNEAETAEIWDCALTKMCGKLQDPVGYEMFETQAGKAWVAGPQQLKEKRGGIFGGFTREEQASLSEVARMSFADVQQQIEGEAHVLFSGHLIRTQLFNPAIKTKLPSLKLNRYLAIGEHTEPVRGEPGYGIVVPKSKPKTETPERLNSTRRNASADTRPGSQQTDFPPPTRQSEVAAATNRDRADRMNRERAGRPPIAERIKEKARAEAEAAEEEALSGFEAGAKTSTPQPQQPVNLESDNPYENYDALDFSGVADDGDKDMNLAQSIQRDSPMMANALLAGIESIPTPTDLPSWKIIERDLSEALATIKSHGVPIK